MARAAPPALPAPMAPPAQDGRGAPPVAGRSRPGPSTPGRRPRSPPEGSGASSVRYSTRQRAAEINSRRFRDLFRHLPNPRSSGYVPRNTVASRVVPEPTQMVFGLFSKEKALQRTIEKATNKLAQQPDRWGALEKLREDGSDEALFGLCKRWSVTSTKGVEDEQEKNWVVDVLVEKGQSSLAPILRYMKSAEQIAFPLKVLERIADHDQQLKVVDELFKAEPPGYVRMPERRIDLVKWFC